MATALTADPQRGAAVGAPPARLRPGRLVTAALVTLALAAVTAVQVLPRPSQLGSRFATDVGDPVFLMWQMATQWHAVLHHPTALLQANIFYPHTDAIAYSDNLIAYLPVFGPVYALSGHNVVLAYNVLAFVGYIGGALAVYALAVHLLGSRAPAFAAALLFSLSPYRSAVVGHVQLVGYAFVPLAFLLLMRYLERRRLRDALLLGAVSGATWLGSLYCAVLLAVCLATFLVVWAARRRGDLGPRLWRGLAAAVAVAGVLVAPTLPAYVRVQRTGLITRTAGELITVRASSFARLPPSAVYHLAGSTQQVPDNSAMYPGAVLGILAVAAVVTAVLLGRRGLVRAAGGADLAAVRRAEYALPLVAAGVVCLLVMIGPNRGILLSEPDRVLRRVVPGMANLRDLTRFWLLPLTVGALAAGYTLFRVQRWLGPRRGTAAVLAVCAVATLELAYRQDFVAVRTSGPATAVNDVLRGLPPGPVVELPLASVNTFAYAFTVAPWQLRSVADGLPRVEGYSGEVPADVRQVIELARTFPSALSIRALRADGVRYVVLHGGPSACWGTFSPAEMATIRAGLVGQEGVAAVRAAGPDVVVELAPAPVDRASLPPAPAVPERAAPPCDLG